MRIETISSNHHSQFTIVEAMRRQHQIVVYQDENYAEKEKQRDTRGSILLFTHAGIPAASCRVVPLGCNLTLTERVSNFQAHINSGLCWEIQRFVVKPEYRGLKNIREIYRLTATWLLNDQRISHIAAVCNQRVARLLIRTGLKVATRCVRIDNQRSHYVLLCGNVHDIYQKLQKH